MSPCRCQGAQYHTQATETTGSLKVSRRTKGHLNVWPFVLNLLVEQRGIKPQALCSPSTTGRRGRCLLSGLKDQHPVPEGGVAVL